MLKSAGLGLDSSAVGARMVQKLAGQGVTNRQVLPAMGYGAKQVKELSDTIAAVPCDVVLIATPIDLAHVLTIDKPSTRVTYELEEHDHLAGDHDHAAPHGHQSFDAFVEMTGEWEGRQTVDGETEANSGGKSLWLTPGARFNSASGFTVAAAVGLPLWQRIRASHPDNAFRLILSLGRAF